MTGKMFSYTGGFLSNKGLGLKLKIYFTVVSLLPLMALGFFSFILYFNSFQETTLRYTESIIKEANINLFLTFSKIDDISKTLLNNSVIQDVLLKDEKKSSDDYLEDRQKVNRVLQSIMFSNDYITSVYILPEKNKSLFFVGSINTNYGETLFTDEYREQYRKSDLYEETLKEYNNYKWWPPRFMGDKRVFILTRKLYDVERGILGVLVIHISEKIMDDMVERMCGGKQQVMLLTDERGRIIYHMDKSLIDSYLDDRYYEQISKNDTGKFISVLGTNRYLRMHTTFLVTSWKFIVEIPYSAIMEEANKIRLITLIIAGLCLLLVILVSSFVTSAILKPVKRLMSLMKKGSEGDMTVRFEDVVQDEIGQLGECFNTMMSSIQRLMQMVEYENQQKVEAQIKALEAHINPHFLYNTLASIYWNALSKGNSEIAQMSLSLSNFFKLGLNKGKEFTTIGKEVEHVKEYLFIQKKLYEDSFDLEIDVCPEVLDYMTIKLILQPLVENSLVHGFQNMERRGRIAIKVSKQDMQVVLKVTDNGLGIPNLAKDGLQKIIDEGYGLKNLQDRLKLYFKDKFSMECESVPGIETVFTVKIPVIKYESGGEYV